MSAEEEGEIEAVSIAQQQKICLKKGRIRSSAKFQLKVGCSYFLLIHTDYFTLSEEFPLGTVVLFPGKPAAELCKLFVQSTS